MGLKNLRSKASEKAESKFDKKLQFYAKVRSQTLQPTKTISKSATKRAKKVKAYDLSALTELLPELNLKKEIDAPTKYKLNSKSRQKLLLEEGKQLAALLGGDGFKSDPLGAIYEHLKSTQPAIEIPEKKRKKTETGKKKKKKKGKKPTPTVEMEM